MPRNRSELKSGGGQFLCCPPHPEKCGGGGDASPPRPPPIDARGFMAKVSATLRHAASQSGMSIGSRFSFHLVLSVVY